MNDVVRPTVDPSRTSTYVSPTATSTKKTLSAIQRASIASKSASGIGPESRLSRLEAIRPAPTTASSS